MGRSTKTNNPAGITECIFCGGTELTEEHLFADWFKKVIPRTETSHSIFKSYPKRVRAESAVYAPKRDMLSLTLRVVCRECNTGWMHDLQDAAIPIVRPMLLGTPILLSKENILTLASWITMMTMVREFMESSTRAVAISKDDRYQFRLNRIPFENWKIWIGFYDEPNGRLSRHTSAAIFHVDPSIPLGPESVPDQANVQATTFVMGRFVAHVYSEYMNGFPYEIRLPERFKALHIETSINWPFGLPLNSDDYMTVSGHLMTLTDPALND